MLTSRPEAAVLSPSRIFQSAMMAGSTVPKNAALAHFAVEYSLASPGLQDRAPFAAQSARRRPYLWLHYQRHNSHSSYARIGSFFHTRDKGYRGVAL